MDDARFDAMSRGLDAHLTRRRAGGLAAGALLALGLAAESDAKKKKKKKKKKGGSGGTGGGGSVNISCSNVGAPCGNTLVCSCRFTKTNQQICLNGVTPPNGLNFQPCQSQANCPAGQYCDLLTSLCASTCAN